MEEEKNSSFESALAKKGTHRISLTPVPMTMQHHHDIPTVTTATFSCQQPEMNSLSSKKRSSTWMPAPSQTTYSPRPSVPLHEKAPRPYSMTSLCSDTSSVPTITSNFSTSSSCLPLLAAGMTSLKSSSSEFVPPGSHARPQTRNDTNILLSTVPIVKNVPDCSSTLTSSSFQPSCNKSIPCVHQSHQNWIPLVDPPVPVKLDCPLKKKLGDESPRISQDCWKDEAMRISSEEASLWLSGSEPLPMNAPEQYFEHFECSGKTLLEVLRSLCSRLYLQGETNKIDRILESLSFRYVMCNPSSHFRAKECVHSVVYSLFLLNTDLHLAKMDKHMTLHQFLSNTCAALEESDFFDDVPVSVKRELEDMYISIREQPLGVPREIQTLIEPKPEPFLRRTLSRGRGTISSLYRRQSKKRMERTPPAIGLHSESREPLSLSSKKRDSTCLSFDMDSVVALDPKRNWTGRKSREQFRAVLCDGTVMLYAKKSLLNFQDMPARCLSLNQAWPELCENEQETHLAITLADESVHLFYAPSPILKTWKKACLMASACVSSIPLKEGSSNIDYGWLHVGSKDAQSRACEPQQVRSGFWWSLFSRKGEKSAEASIQNWLIPEMSLDPSTLSRADQETKMAEYLVYIEQTLSKLERIKEPMLQHWHMDRRARSKALANWDRKHAYFQAQLAKFGEYQEALQCCDDAPTSCEQC